MDKKQKEKDLQELKKIEKKYSEIMDQMALQCKTNELLSLLIRMLLEDARESEQTLWNRILKRFR